MITMDVKMEKSIGKLNSLSLLFPNYWVDNFLDLVLSFIYFLTKALFYYLQ